MKLSELIAHVGDENVQVQKLAEAFTRARYSGKKNCTEITFGTKEDFCNPGCKMIAIVLWIPKDKLPTHSPKIATEGMK